MPLRLAKNTYPTSTMAIRAKADGMRAVYSFTAPATADMAAMHQWKKGGLKASSTPLLTGNTQLPCWSMDKATTASRGSPRVWKELSPKKSNREHAHNSAKIQKYFLLSILSSLSCGNLLQNIHQYEPYQH